MAQTGHKELNPDVPPFIPKSLSSNNSYPTARKQHDCERTDGKLPTSKLGGPSILCVPTKTFVVQENDFPAIISDLGPLNEPIWSRAGFRSFKDVAASTSMAKQGYSVEGMEESHESDTKTKTKKRKKKKLKKEVPENNVQNRTKPKSKGITLDQIVVAKIVQEASKKKKESVSLRPRKLMVKTKKKSKEIPRNQLDSTAPKQRKGKTREVPKKKKPTTMKKFIIMEKELRKRNLVASKEFKRKNLERAIDAVIKSVHISHLNETCVQEEIGSGDHVKSSEQKDECIEDLVASLSSLSLEQKVSELIHCNDYREYCNQCLTDEIDRVASDLLIEMVRLQDRMHAKDPQKARIKRRYCCGLKEVDKYLTIQKVKCLLVAPDIQQIVKDGVLDKTVHNLIDKCRESETPIIFCLTRSQLGYLCKKRAKISCVAILNPSGADELFKCLINLALESNHEYEKLREEMFKIIVRNEDIDKGRDVRPKEIEVLRMKMKRQTLFWRKKRKSNEHPM